MLNVARLWSFVADGLVIKFLFANKFGLQDWLRVYPKSYIIVELWASLALSIDYLSGSESSYSWLFCSGIITFIIFVSIIFYVG